MSCHFLFSYNADVILNFYICNSIGLQYIYHLIKAIPPAKQQWTIL